MAERFSVNIGKGTVHIYGYPRWQEIKTGHPDWARKNGAEYIVRHGTRTYLENFQVWSPALEEVKKRILLEAKALFDDGERDHRPERVSFGAASNSMSTGEFIVISGDGQMALVFGYSVSD